MPVTAQTGGRGLAGEKHLAPDASRGGQERVYQARPFILL